MSESSLPENILFHGNGGTYPPYGTITASDHGPAVVVATWIMTCLMGLAIIARFGTRHSLDKDSIAIGVACVRITLILLLASAHLLLCEVGELTCFVLLGFVNIPEHNSPPSRQLRTWKT